MARREPFTQTEVSERKRKYEAAQLRSRGDLDHLAYTAGVPAAAQAGFIDELKEQIRRFRLDTLVSKQEEPSRKAEAMDQIVAAVEQLQRVLASLPVVLRQAIEPDMIGRVYRDSLIYRSSGSVARKRRLPEAEEEPEDVSLPKLVTRKRRLPAGLQMPGFDVPLADLSNKAKAESARYEAQVSPEWTRRKGTYRRNDFALALKALARTRSPNLAKDERAAEKWVAEVLAVLKIQHPNPERRPADFRRMFSIKREPLTAEVAGEGLMAEDQTGRYFSARRSAKAPF
jgi:hypothetical protein